MGYHHPCPSLKILNVHLVGSTTILYAFTPDLIISVWNKPWRGSSFIYSKASTCYPPPYSVWTILKTLKYWGGGGMGGGDNGHPFLLSCFVVSHDKIHYQADIDHFW